MAAVSMLRWRHLRAYKNRSVRAVARLFIKWPAQVRTHTNRHREHEAPSTRTHTRSTVVAVVVVVVVVVVFFMRVCVDSAGWLRLWLWAALDRNGFAWRGELRWRWLNEYCARNVVAAQNVVLCGLCVCAAIL